MQNIWKFAFGNVVCIMIQNKIQQTMKLSKVALLALKGMGRDQKKELASRIGLTEDTFYRWIRNNDDNLTKVATLAVIQQALGLEQHHLLEDTIAA